MCATNTDIVKRYDLTDFERPILETRKFRELILENGLQILLISDDKCDRSASALTVNIGSLMDPVEFQGCAHFLEHMLFLGTKKYPEEGAFQKYLREHAGLYNAFTQASETTYHFSVNPDSLKNTLDQFAQFFFAPLFTESAVDREINAVDSEHSKNILNDEARLYQILKHVANPNSCVHHFSTGNAVSLRPLNSNPRAKVVEFYNQHYSAHLMKLCILGKESLDELENIVSQTGFANIPRNSVTMTPQFQKSLKEIPYRKNDLAKWIKIVPVRDIRRLQLSWLVTEQVKNWRTKPCRYILNLLGHEGQGSVLSRLKDMGYVTKLATSIDTSFYITDYSLLTCAMELTELGCDHVKEIVELIYAYIKLLSTNPIQSYLLEELKAVADLQFKFLSLPDPESYVTMMSLAMIHLPTDYLLSGSLRIFEDDIPETQKLLSYLTPENSLMVTMFSRYKDSPDSQKSDKSTDAWETEPWYQIKYNVNDIPSEYMNSWNNPTVNETNDLKSIHFPTPNIYIPKDTDLLPAPKMEQQFPVKTMIIPEKNISTWFKQDTTFKTPRAFARFTLNSPYSRKGVYEASINLLYWACVSDAMNEDLYNAIEASLTWYVGSSMKSDNSGDVTNTAMILIGGFSEPLPKLLDSILQHCHPSKLTEKNFNTAKHVLVRQLSIDSKFMQAYKQAAFRLRQFCQKPFYHPEDCLKNIEKIQFEDIQKAWPEIIENVVVESYIGGNVDTSRAKSFFDSFIDRFDTYLHPTQSANHTEFEPNRVIDLRSLENFHSDPRLRIKAMNTNVKDENRCSQITIHMGKSSASEAALFNLLKKYLDQPFFDSLRTKQQLGYLTSTTRIQLLGIDTLGFFVQSKALEANELTTRIEAFLEYYLNGVENLLSVSQFEEIRNSTISFLAEKPTSLEEEAQRYIVEMHLRRFGFDRRLLQIEYLKTCTYEMFLDYIRNKVIKAPWIATEIYAHQPVVAQPARETQDDVPLEPKNPIAWFHVPEPFDEFLNQQVTEHIEFPLPGSKEST